MTEVTPAILVGPMQARVLQELLKDGAANLEIAKRLWIAEDTVKAHIKALLQRSGANNRTHLAIMVARKEIEVFVRGRAN